MKVTKRMALTRTLRERMVERSAEITKLAGHSLDIRGRQASTQPPDLKRKLPEGSVQWPIGSTGTWTGRNGTFDSIGICLDATNYGIALQPVGKRGNVGNCMIEIPRSALIEFIVALTRQLSPPLPWNPKLSPEKEIASLSRADSDRSSPALVATGQGESPDYLKPTGKPVSVTKFLREHDAATNGVIRLDAEFMKDVKRM